MIVNVNQFNEEQINTHEWENNIAKIIYGSLLYLSREIKNINNEDLKACIGDIECIALFETFFEPLIFNKYINKISLFKQSNNSDSEESEIEDKFSLKSETDNSRKSKSLNELLIFDKTSFSETSDIFDFVLNILYIGRFNVASFVMSIINIKQFCEFTGIPLCQYTWRPIFITSLILSDKMWDDKCAKTGDIAKILGFLSPCNLTYMELLFAVSTNWNFLIALELIKKHITLIMDLTENTTFLNKVLSSRFYQLYYNERIEQSIREKPYPIHINLPLKSNEIQKSIETNGKSEEYLIKELIPTKLKIIAHNKTPIKNDDNECYKKNMNIHNSIATNVKQTRNMSVISIESYNSNKLTLQHNRERYEQYPLSVRTNNTSVQRLKSSSISPNINYSIPIPKNYEHLYYNINNGNKTNINLVPNITNNFRRTVDGNRERVSSLTPNRQMTNPHKPELQLFARSRSLKCMNSSQEKTMKKPFANKENILTYAKSTVNSAFSSLAKSIGLTQIKPSIMSNNSLDNKAQIQINSTPITSNNIIQHNNFKFRDSNYNLNNITNSRGRNPSVPAVNNSFADNLSYREISRGISTDNRYDKSVLKSFRSPSQPLYSNKLGNLSNINQPKREQLDDISSKLNMNRILVQQINKNISHIKLDNNNIYSNIPIPLSNISNNLNPSLAGSKTKDLNLRSGVQSNITTYNNIQKKSTDSSKPIPTMLNNRTKYLLQNISRPLGNIPQNPLFIKSNYLPTFKQNLQPKIASSIQRRFFSPRINSIGVKNNLT
ncbi:uncharacterized protein CMU_033180 [Cryptosporidium muris RN66]|uniref:Cyclin, N-terminal domain-containing protein n=1 Tax=Cryptosporidium muris (strain RN66) TaxID=441375 RepID=B6AFE2_CRYMR|nr:uncharacterized protein CMU_033180 [Cryptosporidium muris RN66]EEA06933.1 hypothetical protein, conserved [Cryptosporidium muris RN66]|eukprot:XP_002141282.1 hypothetical protein [Cryptosporidium muris RN66]